MSNLTIINGAKANVGSCPTISNVKYTPNQMTGANEFATFNLTFPSDFNGTIMVRGDRSETTKVAHSTFYIESLGIRIDLSMNIASPCIMNGSDQYCEVKENVNILAGTYEAKFRTDSTPQKANGEASSEGFLYFYDGTNTLCDATLSVYTEYPVEINP